MMKKVINFIVNLDLYIACVTLVVLILITFTGVISRYCFNAPYTWGEEMQLFMIVWTIWFAGSASCRYGQQICVDMVVDLFPKTFQKVLEVVIYIISAALLFYLFKKGIVYVQQLYKTNRTTEILHISRALIYSCVPICSLLMIVNMTYATWCSVFGKKKKKEGNE
ncbi:MAG: TRAP transporter small permease [Clostridiaceae bacterium]|nr:TRAP transporter small permease [Clostridiaceae bacterium]